MSMTNFRAEDMPGKGDDMKVAMAEDSKTEQPQAQQPQAQQEQHDDSQDEAQDDDEEAPDGTTREILDWVGDDPARAQRALDKEEASERPRSGVTTPLKKILNGDDS